VGFTDAFCSGLTFLLVGEPSTGFGSSRRPPWTVEIMQLFTRGPSNITLQAPQFVPYRSRTATRSVESSRSKFDQQSRRASTSSSLCRVPLTLER